MRQSGLAAVAFIVVLAGGCASNPDEPLGEDQNSHQVVGTTTAVTGAATGGATGGGVASNTGKRSSGKSAASVTPAAAASSTAGHSLEEREKRLREIAAGRNVEAMQVDRLKDNQVRISISSESLFDTNRSDIKSGFTPILDKIAEVLRSTTGQSIRVVGHTDSQGPEDYNQRLSGRRAQAIGSYLISRGVAAGHITTAGLGEKEPRASNDTVKGRAQNRRVEIILQQK